MKSFICCVAIIAIIVLTFTLCACQGKIPQKYVRTWTEGSAYSQDDYAVLDTEGDVRILQLTDIHYDSTNNKKSRTLELIKDVIEESDPDLIAVTGDWCSFAANRKKNSREVFDVIDAYGIPWAVVFGNHDREGIVSAYDFADMFAGYENCIFDAGYSNIGGAGNYAVVLRQNGQITGACIFMDTHSSVRLGSTKYQSIAKEQIEWYKWTIDGLDALFKAEGNDSVIPTLLFTHIPINEYVSAFEQGEILLGGTGEKCCVPYENTGMFEAIKEKQSTKAIFCGHDHANAGVALYEGVRFVYGMQSGWCKGYAEDSEKGGTLAVFGKDSVNIQFVASEKLK